jgi:hypothetical protein
MKTYRRRNQQCTRAVMNTLIIHDCSPLKRVFNSCWSSLNTEASVDKDSIEADQPDG